MIVRGAGFLLLVALAAHVVPRAPAQEADRLDDAAVRQAVERVMSSADFCHLLPRARAEGKGPFERFLEWMFGAPEEEGEESGVRISIGAGFGPLLGWILYLVAGTAIALVLAFMIRALAAKRESRPATAPGGGGAATALTATAPPGEQPAGAYLGRALACARAGDYRTAIAQLLLGGMSWLERAGAIRFRKGLTNRDYLRAAGRHPEFRSGLHAIVGHFEEIHFGRRAATPERFAICLDHFRRSVRDGETG